MPLITIDVTSNNVKTILFICILKPIERGYYLKKTYLS